MCVVCIFVCVFVGESNLSSVKCQLGGNECVCFFGIFLCVCVCVCARACVRVERSCRQQCGLTVL